MKKSYTKPIFIKTLYISTDMIANVPEEDFLGITGASSSSWFGGDPLEYTISDAPDGCNCTGCPDDSLFCYKKCSDGDCF